jgi:hypothetical protein
MTIGYDFTKKENLFIVDKTLKELNMDIKKYVSDIPYGVYLGITDSSAKEHIYKNNNKFDYFTSSSFQEKFKEWLYRWAIKRYRHLKDLNRLQNIRNNPIMVFEKSKDKRRNSSIY